MPVDDPDRSHLPRDATEVVADTGEFRRDFGRGLFTVDTPQSQVAAGRMAGAPVRLTDIEVRIENPVAAVAVQSLDGAPIAGSHRLLISLTARAVPAADKGAAMRIEPLAGTLAVRAPDGLTLQRPGGGPLPGAHRNGEWYVIDLGQVGGASWMTLE